MDAREKMRMIRETGSTVLTEMDRHFTAVIRETEERRRELQAIARPRRPDLLEQVQQNLRAMSALIEQVALREQLISRWERSTADDICRAYEERLSAGDGVAVELFECYAEAILQRKANATALAAFRARRERARESRLTPEQARAKREVQDLQKIEASISLVRAGLMSMLKLYEGGG